MKFLGVTLESSNLRADVLELLSLRQSDSPEGCPCDGSDCHMSVDFVLSPGVMAVVVRVRYSLLQLSIQGTHRAQMRVEPEENRLKLDQKTQTYPRLKNAKQCRCSCLYVDVVSQVFR